MLEAITPLFDIVTLPEQTPLTLKGMPCERLFIIKTGTVDVLTDGMPESGARCAIGMYVASVAQKCVPQQARSELIDATRAPHPLLCPGTLERRCCCPFPRPCGVRPATC
jgi:hypothetical protein